MINLLYRLSDALRRRTLKNDHGRLGEDLAHRHLRRHGCTIVARNYRPPYGGVEIDLVAWHCETLVFVEVKARSGTAFGTPERAVDREKKANVRRAAQDYARRAGVDWEKTRFDIVSVVLEKPVRIEWIRDAWSSG